ncbi:MAG: DAK2 domain-containing protein [Oscillospiraceae bacterium]|nr:DAK2 domain-containing protein [Oscillospiraceae bacterium]
MINGKILRDAIISAAYAIANNKKSVDELNVFPVPDGDTGTNMSMAIGSVVSELKMMDDDVTAAAVAKSAASALLRGARGNSGVILSLIFRGFSKGLAGKREADCEGLTEALRLGVENAYKAVMNPTEGTILTVARMGYEKAKSLEGTVTDEVVLWEEVCKECKIALDNTPNQLPALKKAGVVDAGGAGLLIIFEAMLDVFKGGKIVEPLAKGEAKKITVDTFSSTVGDFDEVINFTYCTEMLITKDEGCDDPSKLRAYLETIGDCVVVVDDEEIIKVHVHTNDPGKAIQKGLEFGYINLPKIENMKMQHKQRKQDAKQEFVPAKPENDYGFVAVSAGKGLDEMFHDIGVDCIVSGGQTMNPSTDNIYAAICSCPAKQVFVLPNNKNIIMAAEQAAKLVNDRKVCVLQTRTIPQGISAMLAFDPDSDFKSNSNAMTEALNNVGTGQLTFAARDSDFEGHEIKKGEILALENGKLSFVEKELEKAAYKLTKKLVKSDSSFVTIIYGEDVTEEMALALCERIEAKYPALEVSVVNGGQPVYYYILSVE